MEITAQLQQPSRKIETGVYCTLWFFAIGLYTLDVAHSRSMASLTPMTWFTAVKIVVNLIPFFILFILNNALLIPKLLLRGNVRIYLVSVSVALIIFWLYQYYDFSQYRWDNRMHAPPPSRPRPEFGIGPGATAPTSVRLHPPRSRLFPMPLLLNFTYGILIVVCNIAVALMFRYIDGKLEQERINKSNAESALANLRSQINPHFYMNMLNNIHGMIEIDPEKAQNMVIGMSKLMRYILYESSFPNCPLEKEVEFIDNYIELMRERYSSSKVEIVTAFPSAQEMKGIVIAPLLFLVFVENAFKHGISYRQKSFIDISVDVHKDHLELIIVNSSNNETSGQEKNESGIGLKNVRQRLSLIYGQRARLITNHGSNRYLVHLSLPLHI